MILRRSKHDGMSSRTRFRRCNGSISCARTFRAQILRSQLPLRRERTRKAAKSSSHFAPKSLSFTQESLGRKGKKRSRTSNKNERARTSSHICDARFMRIFIVREKRHKNYSQKREKSARKRSIKAYHLCSTKKNVVSTMTGKTRGTNEGGGAE